MTFRRIHTVLHCNQGIFPVENLWNVRNAEVTRGSHVRQLNDRLQPFRERVTPLAREPNLLSRSNLDLFLSRFLVFLALVPLSIRRVLRHFVLENVASPFRPMCRVQKYYRCVLEHVGFHGERHEKLLRRDPHRGETTLQLCYKPL